MPNRIIKSRVRSSTVQLADCLGSLLALELLAPSPDLYLISPWLSDMPLVTNQFGQYRPVVASLVAGDLGLAQVLNLLAERGMRIRIIYKSDQPQTEQFIGRLPASIERRATATLHEKGLVTAQFYLRGSMNFTFSGSNLNDEAVELTTEPTQVALALAEARVQWEALAPCP